VKVNGSSNGYIEVVTTFVTSSGGSGSGSGGDSSFTMLRDLDR
jgi:hypothetical protein